MILEISEAVFVRFCRQQSPLDSKKPLPHSPIKPLLRFQTSCLARQWWHYQTAIVPLLHPKTATFTHP